MLVDFTISWSANIKVDHSLNTDWSSILTTSRSHLNIIWHDSREWTFTFLWTSTFTAVEEWFSTNLNIVSISTSESSSHILSTDIISILIVVLLLIYPLFSITSIEPSVITFVSIIRNHNPWESSEISSLSYTYPSVCLDLITVGLFTKVVISAFTSYTLSKSKHWWVFIFNLHYIIS